MVNAADEQVHDEGASDGPAAREGYDFVWWDNGAGGLARVVYDLASSKAESTVRLCADGRVVASRSPAETPMLGPPGPAEYGVRAGLLALTLREPLARWHIGQHAPALDLRWTASQEPVRLGSGFLQAGRVTGEVEHRGETQTVDAPAVRTRAWAPTGGPSLVLQAGDLVLGLNATRRAVTAAVLGLGSVVIGFEQLSCLTDRDGTVHIEATDDTGRSVEVRLSTVSGRRGLPTRGHVSIVHGAIVIGGASLPAFGRLEGGLESVALEHDGRAVVTS